MSSDSSPVEDVVDTGIDEAEEVEAVEELDSDTEQGVIEQGDDQADDDVDPDEDVRVKDLEQEGDIAADYLEELLDIADLDGDLDIDVEGDRAAVSIVGADLQQLVGRDGEVLDALQELTRLAVYRETGERSRLMLDVSGFRAEKRARLVELADRDGGEGPRERRARLPRPDDAVRAQGRARRGRGRRPELGVRGRGAPSLRGGASELSDPDVSRETPSTPTAARGAFPQDRLKLAERYAGLLATEGVMRGLIGPREAPRLWERHLLNCAALSEAIPAGATVCDIGSGAGLPGLVLAIARPDVAMTLVEPLLRRTTFLEEVVAELGLETVTVERGRADALHGKAQFDVVTSRAVAPLGRLLEWSMPLVAPAGSLVAMKGRSVADEVLEARPVVARMRTTEPEILELGEGEFTATVVRVTWADPTRVSWPPAGGRATGPEPRTSTSKKRRHPR